MKDVILIVFIKVLYRFFLSFYRIIRHINKIIKQYRFESQFESLEMKSISVTFLLNIFREILFPFEDFSIRDNFV